MSALNDDRRAFLLRCIAALKKSQDLTQFNGPIKDRMVAQRVEQVKHTEAALESGDGLEMQRAQDYLLRCTPVRRLLDQENTA